MVKYIVLEENPEGVFSIPEKHNGIQAVYEDEEYDDAYELACGLIKGRIINIEPSPCKYYLKDIRDDINKINIKLSSLEFNKNISPDASVETVGINFNNLLEHYNINKESLIGNRRPYVQIKQALRYVLKLKVGMSYKDILSIEREWIGNDSVRVISTLRSSLQDTESKVSGNDEDLKTFISRLSEGL